MALRLTVLIAASSLLLGCLKARPEASRPEGCGSCHAPHYVELAGCADCHRGQPSARRVELAHARLLSGRAAEHVLTTGPAVNEGRQLVEAAACRRCHTIDGRGNRLATNLDDAVWMREQRQLTTSITEPVENMPAFGFDRDQTQALVAFLLSSARPNATAETYRVQFARDAARAHSAFEEKCGGCHRRLTQLGPEGSGRVGPNLSGLLTSFYPSTAPGNKRWSREALTAWIANPRSFRPGTLMPPVSISKDEIQQIADRAGESGESVRASSRVGVIPR